MHSYLVYLTLNIIFTVAEVREFRKVTDHFRGISRICLEVIKENRKTATWDELELETLRFQPIMPKNLPGTQIPNSPNRTLAGSWQFMGPVLCKCILASRYLRVVFVDFVEWVTFACLRWPNIVNEWYLRLCGCYLVHLFARSPTFTN
jgi:hypothetical protein